jgi:hypothetical protein
MDALGRGVFVTVGRALGVTSFGINVERWPPNADGHPEHDEATSGQEEVYAVLEGSAVLRVGDEEHLLEPGVFARVGPGVRRKLLAGPEGAAVLCLGAIPGEPFRPSGPAARAG